MVEENLRGAVTLPIPNILTPSEYQNSLYQKVIDWSKSLDPNAVVRTFPRADIPEWEWLDCSEGLGTALPVSISLERGAILRVGEQFLGLALGEGVYHPMQPRARRLMFGADSSFNNLSPFAALRDMTVVHHNRHGGDYSGEFYQDEDGRLALFCWADAFSHGGEELYRRWSQARLLSEEGVEAGLRLVQRVVENKRLEDSLKRRSFAGQSGGLSRG